MAVESFGRENETMSSGNNGKLSDDLWAAAAGTYDKILAHPFCTGLTQGTLDRDAFRYFVLQDDHLMHSYVRTLSLLAARSPDMIAAEMFIRHASEATAAARVLHAETRHDLGVSDEVAAAEPVAPTTLAYMSFLRATTSSDTFTDALGAMLPCYWMFWKVCEALAERSSPDPLYARFIATYGGEDFARFANEVLTLTDRLGADMTARARDQMRDRFVTAARYEWMFWDAAYRREEWPY
jgi:thiaminase/transcriptional activator TenA